MFRRSLRPLGVSLLLLGLLAPAAVAAPVEKDRGRNVFEAEVEDYCGLTLIESLDELYVEVVDERSEQEGGVPSREP